MKPYLSAGKITSTHGVKGEVKVQPFTDFPRQFEEFTAVYLDEEGRQALSIAGVKFAKNMPVLKLKEIDTVEQAQTLLRKELFAKREEFSLEEGSFFIADLIGLQVSDSTTGALYGTITEVTQTGANDVYHIKTKGGNMHYIPAIKEVVLETNIEEKTMKIKPLEGLFDEN